MDQYKLHRQDRVPDESLHTITKVALVALLLLALTYFVR
jgi:hypothetical protein